MNKILFYKYFIIFFILLNIMFLLSCTTTTLQNENDKKWKIENVKRNEENIQLITLYMARAFHFAELLFFAGRVDVFFIEFFFVDTVFVLTEVFFFFCTLSSLITFSFLAAASFFCLSR